MVEISDSRRPTYRSNLGEFSARLSDERVQVGGRGQDPAERTRDRATLPLLQTALGKCVHACGVLDGGIPVSATRWRARATR
jgi:hypothetical protein